MLIEHSAAWAAWLQCKGSPCRCPPPIIRSHHTLAFSIKGGPRPHIKNVCRSACQGFHNQEVGAQAPRVEHNSSLHGAAPAVADAAPHPLLRLRLLPLRLLAAAPAPHTRSKPDRSRLATCACRTPARRARHPAGAEVNIDHPLPPATHCLRPAPPPPRPCTIAAPGLPLCLERPSNGPQLMTAASPACYCTMISAFEIFNR